ncbi:MAG: Gfo/Idh/MocA family oxidoreductase [Planctomycetaceae bacterium]|nr:Gfo/Idh/MocA family oxidoreductase [Planctomycetaceae bacterium]
MKFHPSIKIPSISKPKESLMLNRNFMTKSGIILSAAAASVVSNAYAEGTDETIKAVLIGCGGRGTGAAANFLKNPNTKIIAVGDVFPDQTEKALKNYDLPPEAGFTGFDAYRKAIDYAVANGAVYAILTTPPGFRPIHYRYAVEKGLNCFLEKPCCVDSYGYRMLMEVNKLAEEKNLKVGVGMQRRHQTVYLDGLRDILENKKYGDILFTTVYWNMGGIPVRGTGEEPTEMQRQIRNRYYYVWLCGDNILEQHVHNLDIGNIVLGNWDPLYHPVKCNGMGGRAPRYIPKPTPRVGEIFAYHAVEFEYEDGRRMFSQSRQVPGTWNCVNEFVHGTKGSAPVQRKKLRGEKLPDPYDVEHTDLINAIKENKKYHEGWAGATASMIGIMGRMATYSGQVVTWDQAVNSGKTYMIYENHDSLTLESTPPVLPNADGLYDAPIPGVTKDV